MSLAAGDIEDNVMLQKHGFRSYGWKLVALGAVFWCLEFMADNTTAMQATFSVCVVIAMLRTSYKIGYWNGKREK